MTVDKVDPKNLISIMAGEQSGDIVNMLVQDSRLVRIVGKFIVSARS